MKQLFLFFLSGYIAVQSFAFQGNVSKQPVPDWLDPFPASNPNIEENWPYYYLDFERQVHLPMQTVFHHYRYQVLTAEGVQEMSDITIDFDPSFQKLVFHKIGLERNNRFLDQLDLKKVTSVSTESSTEQHLYDGSMTALFHLDGVQKGDVIVLSYSIEGFNPVHKGHFSTNFYHGFTIPVNHFNYRIFTGNDQEVYFRNINLDIEPMVQQVREAKIYTWTSSPENPVALDDNLPVWTLDLPMTSVSTQKNWAEVVQWALPLFSSPDKSFRLNGIVDRKLEKKEKVQALIRWVQDEIRYLGLESGIGAYQPNPPQKVFSQKFGDCKDKSLLLVALLRKEGVAAFPLLVNTTYKHNLTQFQPSNIAFDHCVVAINLEGKNYFIDPTIANQGGDLEHTYFPDYRVGLLVNEGVSELMELPKPENSEIDIQERIYLDSVGGQAMMEIKTIYKGAKADNIRSEFENNPSSSIQKDYLNFYNNLYPGITSTEEIQFYDENRFGTNEVLVREKYKIGQFWLQDEGQSFIYSRVYPLVLESLISYPGTSARKSPYALGNPFTFKQETLVMLPETWNVKDSEKNITGPTYQYSHQVRGYGERISVKYVYELKEEYLEGELVPEFLSVHEKIKNDLMFTLTYTPALLAGERSGLVVFIVGIMVIIGIFFGKKIYRDFDPKPWIYAENKDIGGWLILPAIGLTITPIRIAYEFITVGYLNKAIWVNASSMGLTEVLAFEMVYNVLFLLFSILLIILFFSRRTSVPKLTIIFYAVNFAAMLVDDFLTGDTAFFESKQLIQAGLAALIWIPYFSISERVKSTFCKTFRNEQFPSTFPQADSQKIQKIDSF